MEEHPSVYLVLMSLALNGDDWLQKHRPVGMKESGTPSAIPSSTVPSP